VNCYQGLRAVVVGGSIGGLTSALLLRELGFHVDVYERSARVLENRGSGIVLQPATTRWFDSRGAREVAELSTVTDYVRYLGHHDEVLHEEKSQWRYSSWSTIYGALLTDFGTDRYHLGEFCAGFGQDADAVTLRFTSGRTETADLAVFADGITSTARRRLFPGLNPEYAGYVGWRGTVPESQLSDSARAVLADVLTYCVTGDSHIILYPIPGPGGETGVGDRLINYVWYRNVLPGPALQELTTDICGNECAVSVHPGLVQERYVDELRTAAEAQLAPAAAEAVRSTAQPYLQVVFDLRIPAMAHHRIAVIGDAAFAARPHAAAGTAKAADDAWTLREHLDAACGDIPAALERWEPAQLRLGNQLVDRVIWMGTRSQVEGTWVPADPELRFGLYGPGI
jgi:2,6-dihydroxypyridine 3-monooxygenase